MLYEELKNLTKGVCTAEEYEAINAVYMSLEDMTKAQAAKLWHQLYAKKHAAEKKAAEEQSHSGKYIYNLMLGAWGNEERRLPNGDTVTVKYLGQKPNGVKFASYYLVTTDIRNGRTETHIGDDSWAEDIIPAAGNPYKLTA